VNLANPPPLRWSMRAPGAGTRRRVAPSARLMLLAFPLLERPTDAA